MRRGLTAKPLATALPFLLALLPSWACREAQEGWIWPPDTAALVEDRPITMAELNQVLGWGLHGRLNSGEGPHTQADTPRLVLEKMIEERLVLAEAARLNISMEAKGISASSLDDEARPGLSPNQSETFRRNLLRRRALQEITARIMAEERRFSAADWRAFWEAWPKNRPTRYLVRALFLPPVPETPKLPKSGNFYQMAQNYKLEGIPVILSAPVWLQSDHLDGGLRMVLEDAWAGRKPSAPMRQEESWAIYEVLELDRESAAVAELKAARAAYELKINEEAFSRWLAARRATADISINPNLIKNRE